MRTVIFDLDGTLADTSRDLINAANVCFQARGLGSLLDPIEDAGCAFRGGRAMLTLGYSRAGDGYGECEVAEDYPFFLQAYADDIDRFTTLYPGAVAAVERLLDGGYIASICTNKPEGLAETLTQRLGIRSLFGALVGADTLPVRKPEAAPVRAAAERAGGALENAVLVGDTVTDREAARNAGIASILVTFGPDGDKVADLAPDALLSHYDDLDRVVASLIG